jgi:hypothetical protein
MGADERKIKGWITFLWYLLMLLPLLSCGGGGDGDNDGTAASNTSTSYSATISPSGGVLEHPDGVTLEFMEGSFDTDTTCSIERAQMPAKTTRAATPVGNVYQVKIDGAESNKPVKITMPLPQSGDGPYTIYRYTGEKWYEAGGTETSGKIETYTTNFSLFTVVSLKGFDLLRRVHFTNYGTEDCTVWVWNYRLTDPVNSPPVSRNHAWPVFAPGAPGMNNEREGLLDIGSYQFCAEYYNSDMGMPEDRGWRYKLIGGDGVSQPFTYTFSNNTPDEPLPITSYVDFTISLTDTLPGRCAGGTANIGSDPGTNPDGSPINVNGSWLFALRCRGQGTDAAQLDIELDESGGSFSGSGKGTDYNGLALDVTIEGTYDVSTNTISGTIDVNDGASTFNFETQLAADTGYFSIERTAGYGCEAEARLVKQ